MANADWTCATVPETGSDSPVAAGEPTVRPSRRSAEATRAIVAGVGPNSCANCAGVRKCRYCERARVGDRLRLGRQRGRVTGLQSDVEGQRRRRRRGPDEGRPGGHESLVAAQRHAAGPRTGRAGARRGGDVEGDRARRGQGQTRAARRRRGAAGGRHVHRPHSALRPQSPPRGERVMAFTRAAGRARRRLTELLQRAFSRGPSSSYRQPDRPAEAGTRQTLTRSTDVPVGRRNRAAERPGSSWSKLGRAVPDDAVVVGRVGIAASSRRGRRQGMADLGHRLKSSAMSNRPARAGAVGQPAERPLRALWSHRASYRVSAG